MKLPEITPVLVVALLLCSCGSSSPPADSNGDSPEGVIMKTYVAILEGDYELAKKNFSPEFIEELITKNGSTFEEYCENTEGWKREWLRVKVVGNDYNKDMWRVKVIPDEGKGAENRPGVVHDLYIIDGAWKIIFWNHYPKS